MHSSTVVFMFSFHIESIVNLLPLLVFHIVNLMKFKLKYLLN